MKSLGLTSTGFTAYQFSFAQPDLTNTQAADNVIVFPGVFKPTDHFEPEKHVSTQAPAVVLRPENTLALDELASIANSVTRARFKTGSQNHFDPQEFAQQVATGQMPSAMNALKSQQIPTRVLDIDRHIFQTDDIARSIIELAANSLDHSSDDIEIKLEDGQLDLADAGDGMDEMDIAFSLIPPKQRNETDLNKIRGRFGIGFYTALRHLKNPSDKVEVVTKKQNGVAYRLVFAKQNGRIWVERTQLSKTEALELLPKGQGTRILISSEDITCDDFESNARRVLRYASQTRAIRINGKQINTEKAETLRSTAYDKEQIAKLAHNRSGPHQVTLVVGDLVVEEYPLAGNVLPGETVLFLPLNADLAITRDKIAINKKIENLFSAFLSQNPSIEEINALSEFAKAWKTRNPASKLITMLSDHLYNHLATLPDLRIYPDSINYRDAIQSNNQVLFIAAVLYRREYLERLSTPAEFRGGKIISNSGVHPPLRLVLSSDFKDSLFFDADNAIVYLSEEAYQSKQPYELAALFMIRGLDFEVNWQTLLQKQALSLSSTDLDLTLTDDWRETPAEHLTAFLKENGLTFSDTAVSLKNYTAHKAPKEFGGFLISCENNERTYTLEDSFGNELLGPYFLGLGINQTPEGIVIAGSFYEDNLEVVKSSVQSFLDYSNHLGITNITLRFIAIHKDRASVMDQDFNRLVTVNGFNYKQFNLYFSPTHIQENGITMYDNTNDQTTFVRWHQGRFEKREWPGHWAVFFSRDLIIRKEIYDFNNAKKGPYVYEDGSRVFPLGQIIDEENWEFVFDTNGRVYTNPKYLANPGSYQNGYRSLVDISQPTQALLEPESQQAFFYQTERDLFFIIHEHNYHKTVDGDPPRTRIWDMNKQKWILDLPECLFPKQILGQTYLVKIQDLRTIVVRTLDNTEISPFPIYTSGRDLNGQVYFGDRKTGFLGLDENFLDRLFSKTFSAQRLQDIKNTNTTIATLRHAIDEASDELWQRFFSAPELKDHFAYLDHPACRFYLEAHLDLENTEWIQRLPLLRTLYQKFIPGDLQEFSTRFDVIYSEIDDLETLHADLKKGTQSRDVFAVGLFLNHHSQKLLLSAEPTIAEPKAETRELQNVVTHLRLHADFELQHMSQQDIPQYNNPADKRDIDSALYLYQAEDPNIYFREWLQNSLDALAELSDQSPERKDIHVTIHRYQDQILTGIEDKAGIVLQNLHALVDPEVSIKPEELMSLGGFGVGFFATLQGARWVRVKTAVPGQNKIAYLQIEPVRDATGKILSLNLKLETQENSEGYFGTKIESLRLGSNPFWQASLFEATVKDITRYIPQSKAKIHLNGELINKNSQDPLVSYAHSSLGKIEIYDGHDPRLLLGYLPLTELPKDLWSSVPKPIQDYFERVGFYINLDPAVLKATVTRDRVRNLDEIKSILAAVLPGLLIQAFLKRVSNPLYTEDLRKLPSSLFFGLNRYIEEVPDHIKGDAANLQRGWFDSLDYSKYQDENHVLQLITQIPFIAHPLQDQLYSLADIKEILRAAFKEDQDSIEFIINLRKSDVLPHSVTIFLNEAIGFQNFSAEIKEKFGENLISHGQLYLNDNARQIALQDTDILTEKLQPNQHYSKNSHIKDQDTLEFFELMQEIALTYWPYTPVITGVHSFLDRQDEIPGLYIENTPDVLLLYFSWGPIFFNFVRFYKELKKLAHDSDVKDNRFKVIAESFLVHLIQFVSGAISFAPVTMKNENKYQYVPQISRDLILQNDLKHLEEILLKKLHAQTQD